MALSNMFVQDMNPCVVFVTRNDSTDSRPVRHTTNLSLDASYSFISVGPFLSSYLEKMAESQSGERISLAGDGKTDVADRQGDGDGNNEKPWSPSGSAWRDFLYFCGPGYVRKYIQFNYPRAISRMVDRSMPRIH